VVWHPESEFGRRTADTIAKHFDGLGMGRDGVAYRVVPVFRIEERPDHKGPEVLPAQIIAMVLTQNDPTFAVKSNFGRPVI
jgi:hypothetical protein